MLKVKLTKAQLKAHIEKKAQIETAGLSAEIEKLKKENESLKSANIIVEMEDELDKKTDLKTPDLGEAGDKLFEEMFGKGDA